MDAIYGQDRPLVFVFVDPNLKCIITDTAKILNFIICFFCKQNIAQGSDISIFLIQLGNHNPSLYINFYQAINLNCVLFIIRVHKTANHITQILHCCVLILHWLILSPFRLFHEPWCIHSEYIILSVKHDSTLIYDRRPFFLNGIYPYAVLNTRNNLTLNITYWQNTFYKQSTSTGSRSQTDHMNKTVESWTL